MNKNAILLSEERGGKILDSGLHRPWIGFDAFSKMSMKKFVLAPTVML